MEMYAVIDTETTWFDEVMSIGVVISDSNFNIIDSKYYIIDPIYQQGGMYSQQLLLIKQDKRITCSREEAISNILMLLNDHDVHSIFAYNATFDYRHLPELNSFTWYDIMRIAAYRQYNSKIKECDCCSTGRLKRNFGVEAIMQLLSGNCSYSETHNALLDAMDEEKLMSLLNISVDKYIPINKP